MQAALAPGQELLECLGEGANALLAIQLRQTMPQQVNGTACIPDAVRFIRGTAESAHQSERRQGEALSSKPTERQTREA